MKRILSITLLVTMLLSLFAGCAKEESSSNLEAAKEYLDASYKNDSPDTPTDYQVVGVVTIEGVTYNVKWTTDNNKISIKAGDNKLVTIDVPDGSAEEIKYVLTATISDADGKTITTTFNRRVPASAAAGLSNEEIVELAYQLAEGEVMDGVATLTAKIVKLKTPYDADYGNITIIVAVPGLEDKPIECYRLTGDKVSNDLCVGDTVTVTGSLKNYNGTIEFDAGCTLDNVVSNGSAKPTDPKLIVDAAFALPGGESLPYFCTLTGKVKSIDTEYSTQYANITITIEVEGSDGMKDLVCYRLKGAGADAIAVGDTVSVTGVIKNYVKDETSTVEFDAGCALDNRIPGDGSTQTPDVDVPAEKPTTVDGILKAAKALKEGEELPYTVTLSGKVSKIDEDYSDEFKNITVTFEVNGTAIKCYRLKVSADKIPVIGDTITVTGTIKNYYGKLEFVNCTCDKLVPGDKAPTDPKAIVDAAYALPKGESLSYEVTLTGKVVKIGTAYSDQYKNITVTIEIAGREDKPIVCFRMKGEGIEKIVGGDTITVTGVIKNYNGTIEFDASCMMTKRVSGGVVVPTNPKEIVDAAFALAPGASLPYTATLTGKIKSIDTEYSDQYKNITVTIEVEGTSGKKDLVCYRMKGEGADTLAVGDTIKVTGVLKNHLHSDGESTTVEFDAGCTFTK